AARPSTASTLPGPAVWNGPDARVGGSGCPSAPPHPERDNRWASAVRVVAPTLRIADIRCFFTVSTDTNMAAAICLLVSPAAASLAASRSRGDRSLPYP